MAQELTLLRVQALYDGKGRFVSPCEVFIRDGMIERITSPGESDSELQRLREEYGIMGEQIHEPQGLVLPGLVNSHHHAYSALAVGMPLSAPAGDLRQVLEKVWWRLDASLSLEDVYISAVVTALESVRCGCTCIIDHHASPLAAKGSLHQIERAFDSMNLKGALCFEISDRNGPDRLDEAIEESLTFSASRKPGGSIGAMLGLHAGFTLSDQTLERIAKQKPWDMPVHVHAGETGLDVRDAKEKGYDGPLHRLNAFGLLDRRSIAAHCVHLTDADLSVAADTGLKIAHCPDSNLNNGVGYSPLDRVQSTSLVLGTDGMGSSTITVARTAYLMHRLQGDRETDEFARSRAILFDNPSALASEMLGIEVGRITEGGPADMAVFEYKSRTPVSPDNWLGHVLFGLAEAPRAKWVYASGKRVLAEGEFQDIDEQAVLQEARQRAQSLWQRLKP